MKTEPKKVEWVSYQIIRQAEAIGLAVISRRDAEFAGLEQYFDGKLCPRKHISARNVDSGRCLACDVLRHRATATPKTNKKLRGVQIVTFKQVKST